MRSILRAVLVTLAASSAAFAADMPAKPPAAPVQPVTETLFGKTVTDNYRYMEALGPDTIAWMKAQGVYARTLLDAIKPRAALEADTAKFTASFGLVTGFVSFGGRDFYEERAPGSDNFDLMVKDGAGTRKLIDVAALRLANGGKPFAINYFLASPDGAKVAVGISAGGSEDAAITVYDAASGAAIAGPVDRAQFGATAWSDDAKTLYFIRLHQLAAGETDIDKYKNATADAWDLKSGPVPVMGASVGHGPRMTAEEFPAIVISPGTPLAGALSINGVQNEIALWTAPVDKVADPATVWTPLVAREDGVTSADMRGDEIFLLSHKDAPTFKVLVLKAGQKLGDAATLVPADAGRVIEAIHSASDALYVLARKGAYSQLLRIPAGTTGVEEVALPFEGHVGEMFSDPRAPGFTMLVSGWVQAPAEYAYDPARKRFAKLAIGTEGDIAAAGYVVHDYEAKAHDGTMVPLSLVQPKDAKGKQIVLIEAYGSYGISELADFSTRRAAAMRQGITYGICHVRGGGELGEAWRLGGKDANKHNTWQDIIACGEDAIARGITTKDKLFIMGGSAGGITMGRALTERPDLFAGVLDLVPAGNTLRAEFSPNGPPNVPEFGTIKTEDGFRNLYDMDTIQHVAKGVRYPAVMVTTGLNDPRVSPWEPAKVAAALQASDTKNPVLLRIDEQAGHGIGSTKTQTDKLAADGIAFIFWRAGKPGWAPEF
jgi:prolyl oligopeptidase